MIKLCSVLLPDHTVHAIPAATGEILKPISVLDGVIENDVTPIITIVSTDSEIVFRVS